MAFALANLSRLGGQNADSPTLWLYKSADTAATADSAGYFNNAADRLKVDDVIIMAVTGGNSLAVFKVNANSRDLAANPPVSGVVDVTSAVVLGSADSD